MSRCRICSGRYVQEQWDPLPAGDASTTLCDIRSRSEMTCMGGCGHSGVSLRVPDIESESSRLSSSCGKIVKERCAKSVAQARSYGCFLYVEGLGDISPAQPTKAVSSGLVGNGVPRRGVSGSASCEKSKASGEINASSGSFASRMTGRGLSNICHAHDPEDRLYHSANRPTDLMGARY